MYLKETTFEEFLTWCKENKEDRSYITSSKLKIIYDYYATHDLKCEGRNCKVSWKGNEFISSFSQPLEYEPTREDFVWNLFHEVWCKTEWATRCGIDSQALGYEAVKAEFGMKIIKALKEAA